MRGSGPATQVLGAAPFGEAARKLQAETGVASVTVEALLTRLDHTDPPR